MPQRKVTFDTVRAMGLLLPDVEVGTAYGSPALKVHGRMFACLAVHSSAEPDSVVITVGFDKRDALIAADPRTYYLTDHYVDHPTVLVRLRQVHPDALPDLLRMGWRFAKQPATKKVASGKRTGPRRA